MKSLKFKDCDALERKMIKAAISARKRAYAPYSNFFVGAAALSKSGKIYLGCNIEGADYTLTTHAEMHAVNCMVFADDTPLKKIAIVLSTEHGYPSPCGLCRQRIREFSNPSAEIISVNLDKNDKIKEIYKTTLAELLPYSFSKKNLES